MAIDFNLPNNYNYTKFRNHMFDTAMHFNTGERDSQGNVIIKGNVTANEFIGGGSMSGIQLDSGKDINTVVTPGAYYSYTPITLQNGPVDNFVFHGVLLVYREYPSNSDMPPEYVVQMLISPDTGTGTWVRRLYTTDPSNEGAMTKWNRILDEKTHVTDTNIHVTAEDRDIISKSLPVWHSIELSITGWNNNVQTVSVPGVLADETKQLVTIVPSKSAASTYRACEIYVTEQFNDSIQFKCTTIPQQNLTVYVTIQEVTNG